MGSDLIVGVRHGHPDYLVGLHALVVIRSDGDRRRPRHRAGRNRQRTHSCRVVYVARRLNNIHDIAIIVRILGIGVNGQDHDHISVEYLPVQRSGHRHIGRTGSFAYRGQIHRQREVHAIRVVVGDHYRSSRQYGTDCNLYVYRPSLNHSGVVRGGNGERRRPLGSTSRNDERRAKDQLVVHIACRSARHSITRRQNSAGRQNSEPHRLVLNQGLRQGDFQLDRRLTGVLANTLLTERNGIGRGSDLLLYFYIYRVEC